MDADNSLDETASVVNVVSVVDGIVIDATPASSSDVDLVGAKNLRHAGVVPVVTGVADVALLDAAFEVDADARVVVEVVEEDFLVGRNWSRSKPCTKKSKVICCRGQWFFRNDCGRPQLEVIVKSLYSITPEFFVIDSKRPICVHSLHMCD